MSQMWFCPNCIAWNGSELDCCLKCNRELPQLPVRNDYVPVDDASRVTLSMRLRAKCSALKEGEL